MVLLYLPVSVAAGASQLNLYLHQAVVLGNTVCTAEGTGLDEDRD